MADIGSLNAFDPSATRSLGAERPTLEQDRERNDALQQQSSGTNPANVEAEARAADTAREARRTQEANADLLSNGQTQAEAALGTDQDQIVLSAEASQALANDNSTVSAVSLGDATPTNQRVQDESSSAQIDGNQDNQSEQTRTLGQFVDQFA